MVIQQLRWVDAHLPHSDHLSLSLSLSKLLATNGHHESLLSKYLRRSRFFCDLYPWQPTSGHSFPQTSFEKVSPVARVLSVLSFGQLNQPIMCPATGSATEIQLEPAANAGWKKTGAMWAPQIANLVYNSNNHDFWHLLVLHGTSDYN